MALTLLDRITRATERLGTVMSDAAGWVYLLCGLFITFDVISRRFLGFSSRGTTEISSYLLAFGISWGLSHTLATRGHIRVDVFVQRLPPRPRSYLHALALAFLVVLGALLARRAWDVVLESWEFNARDVSALSIPLIAPQGAWAVGISIFAVLTVLKFLQVVLLLAVGRGETVNQMLGPRTIEEETEEALEAAGLPHGPAAVAAGPEREPALSGRGGREAVR